MIVYDQTVNLISIGFLHMNKKDKKINFTLNVSRLNFENKIHRKRNKYFFNHLYFKMSIHMYT